MRLNKLRLGIDVRILIKPEIGISVYTLELVSRIASDQNFDLYLYSPSPILERYKQVIDSKVVLRESKVKSVFLKQLWGAYKLSSLLKKDKIDVFWGPAHRLPFIKPKGIKYVLTVHDLVYKYAPNTMSKLSYPIERFMLPKSILKADYVVTDSIATKLSVESEFNISKDTISVIYLGSRYKSYIRSIVEVNREINKYFLFVGTMEPRKNLPLLLRAYAKLSTAQKENCHLHIVGSKGWGRNDLEKVIENLGISEYVKIHGYVDNLTLATLYAGCYAVLMPSIYEGFGLPLLEGMTFGKPGLCGDNSSMPEIVGNAGVIVRHDSIDSVYDGLIKLLDRKNYDLFQENIPNQIKKFDWDTSAKELEKIFIDIIGRV
ncbi:MULTISPECIES: glycosyltransferase family 4 protein [unclassified Francisella]|uniref:glycosyltransferase family 4 protein n=1 Tax=unclassified Francisella TaxID=2610885 RepID=UPI002E35177E|nr:MULTISPECIES: glycosyltransferase family 1 protein [unclassified Francisella]MED7820028.1 glycosyltransferase family 1 protein [Francisella sp. 19S2-4]MED7830848.1 glycosyltransferase family 1 protein [Francisella sp. 19S2-10]